MKVVLKPVNTVWEDFKITGKDGVIVKAKIELMFNENSSKVVVGNIPGSSNSIDQVSESEIMSAISNKLISEDIAITEGFASNIKEFIFPEILFYMKFSDALKDKLINSGDVVVHYPAGPTINDNGSVALIKKEKGTGFYLNYVAPK